MASTNNVRLHRVIRCTTDHLFRAFLDPQAKVKWLPPHGFVGAVQHSDIRVGGGYHMTFTNFRTGETHAFGGTYTQLTPGQRIRFTDKFDDPNLPGEMLVTVTLRAVPVGTELTILQENIPEAIPAEQCYLGWQESLTLLALLVEAEIA